MKLVPFFIFLLPYFAQAGLDDTMKKAMKHIEKDVRVEVQYQKYLVKSDYKREERYFNNEVNQAKKDVKYEMKSAKQLFKEIF